MKKLFILLITIIMCVTAVCFGGCGGSSNPVDNPEVKLVDVNGLSTYNIKDCLSEESVKAINKAKNLVVTLKSHATGKEFVSDSSVINLSNVYKEYYYVDIKNGSKTIVTAKIDFHDVDNDGVVWCEWSNYVVDAVATNLEDDEVEFTSVQETVGLNQDVEVMGEVIVYRPANNWISLFGVKPFHSKEYYVEFAQYGFLSIPFLRKAVYSLENPEFKPNAESTHFGHYDGEWAGVKAILNTRVFGTSNNSENGNVLNTWQSHEYQISALMDHYDDLGDTTKSPFWYLMGTCHFGKTNPYKVTNYIGRIEIYI